MYLGLYVATLALHALLIGYVVGGAAWATVSAALGRRDAIAAAARDWLPFALGAAITAGVAPLVFLQILYQERFYTANLLMAHRWMMIIPALVVGFYLLYAHKHDLAARLPARWQRAGRLATIALAWLCFLFVAWSWTANHLLMLDDAAWRRIYQDGSWSYAPHAHLARWAMWLAAALPLFAAGAVWQLTVDDPAALRRAHRALALLAGAGLVAALAAAVVVYQQLPARSAAAVAASPWRFGLGAGIVVTLGGWIRLAVASPDDGAAVRRTRWLIALGTIAIAVTGALVRERVRAWALQPTRPRVEAAGGLPVFVAVTAMVVVAIYAIARIVRASAPR